MVWEHQCIKSVIQLSTMPFGQQSFLWELMEQSFWLGLKQDGIKTNDFDSGWRWLDGTKLPPGSTLWDLANNEPNDYDFTRPDGTPRQSGDPQDYDGIEDGSEDYGHFNIGGMANY